MSLLPRAAFGATRTLRARASPILRTRATPVMRAEKEESVLSKGAKRDPELYILLTVMTCAFGLAGWYFGRKPTSSSSEQDVNAIANSEPWNSGTSGKYQYHPKGDRSRAPKDAPSALHSVVIPNVSLPKYLHDQFNKYDKDEFDDY